MEASRGFVGTLLQHMRELLGKILLMGYGAPAIPWSSSGNASNGSPRSSLLRDEQSRMLTDGEAWLYRKTGGRHGEAGRVVQVRDEAVRDDTFGQIYRGRKGIPHVVLALTQITGG